VYFFISIIQTKIVIKFSTRNFTFIFSFFFSYCFIGLRNDIIIREGIHKLGVFIGAMEALKTGRESINKVGGGEVIS